MKKCGIKLLYCRTLSSQSGASLTMGSIAASLRKDNHDVEIIFGLRTDLHKSQKILKDISKRPIIIYKPNFKDYSKYFPILKKIIKENSNVKIFLCGPFASLNAKSIMSKNKFIDGILIGDPEETASELIKSADNKFSKWDYNLSGGVWRNQKTKKVIFAEKRKISQSLDSLPFPERDIEKMENVSYINLEASRGCIFNCSFCHVPAYHSQTTSPRRRIRSPKLVVDEIEKLNKTMDKTLFIFNDQLFWAGPQDNKRVTEICEEIIKRKLKIKFYIYLRSHPFPNKKIIDLLCKAGLIRVFLGTENASEKSLKKYNKNTTASKSIYAFKEFKRRNINVHIGHIVFEPRSTVKDIKLNFDFLYSLNKLYRIGVTLESPRIIPQTVMQKELEDEKLMEKGLDYTNLTYAYKFKNKEVGDIFDYIRDTFLNKLKKRWYELEYYCVSGLLLIDIAKKENSRIRITDNHEIIKFVKLTNESNKLLYKFLKKIINKKNRNENIRNQFIKEFIKTKDKLEYSWGKVSEIINEKYGEKPYLELYRGVEPI